MDIHIHGNLNDLTKAEKVEEINRIKTLQKDRLELSNESSLSSSHTKSEKQNVPKNE